MEKKKGGKVEKKDMEVNKAFLELDIGKIREFMYFTKSVKSLKKIKASAKRRVDLMKPKKQ